MPRNLRTDTLGPVHPSGHGVRRWAAAGAGSALAVLAGIVAGCANYEQDIGATKSIYDVRVTTNPAEVAGCRLIERVDSRDSSKGCGLTVQPTPEECLRYQVRRAGGDTLLMNGPVGEAYDCSGHAASTQEGARGTPPAAPPSPAAARTPPAPASPTPVPQIPSPAAAVVPEPVPASGVRITRDRESAKGCVYLGDLASASMCPDVGTDASGDCADQALKAGGDLILMDGARGQIFSCKAKP